MSSIVTLLISVLSSFIISFVVSVAIPRWLQKRDMAELKIEPEIVTQSFDYAVRVKLPVRYNSGNLAARYVEPLLTIYALDNLLPYMVCDVENLSQCEKPCEGQASIPSEEIKQGWWLANICNVRRKIV